MPKPRKNRYKIKLKSRNAFSILVINLLFLNLLTSAQATDTTAVVKVGTSDSSINAFPVSKDKLDHPVNYQSKDSIVYNAKTKQLFLHNQAEISYDDIKVTADYIWYQQDSSLLSALELEKDQADTTKPRLSQGEESSTFTALKYNFKSKRALVENAYSQYGEGFILSSQVKRNADQTINGFRNVYTTCNDEHPHFGIAARKIKIIPNKVAVSGSANLVIEDIPTPLYLPFGMFPLQKGQRSGFKLPTYDMSERLGFGLREFGYYFAISDHVDLLATADVYAFGSFRAGFISSYAYRYRFNGNFKFDYSFTKVGEPYEQGSTKFSNYNIMWHHSVSQNRMPGASFNASVNIVNNKNYQLYNTYDANTYLNNNYSSDISYSKSWEGKPFNFTAALRHNQNTQSHLVAVTLPQISFTVNQLYPFQFRKDITKPRWYEKIGAGYQFDALNRIDFYDTNFNVKNVRFSDFQNGFKHTIPISATYDVFKYFKSTSSFSYNEYWYTKRDFKQYLFSEKRLDTARQDGFFTARDFVVNTSLTTRIYGTKLFKRGRIKGIRHVLSPSISLRYQPDFGSGIGHYSYTTFVDSLYTTRRLSYFDGALLGTPSDGKFGGVEFSLGNTLQLKVKSKKDTINGTRKVNLIDGLDFKFSYNLAVDSFQWSPLTIGYRTTLFENINISAGASFDPYAINKTTGKKSQDFYFQTHPGKTIRFTSANIAIRASLPLKQQNSALNQASDEQKEAIGNHYSMYTDFNIPYKFNVDYNIGLSKKFLVASQKDTLELNQGLRCHAEVNLTTKWRVSIESGYIFKTRELSYSSFDIYRDLHCWQMSLGLIPFGQRTSYHFSLNVKSSVLQDLKLVRVKDFRDNL